MIDTRVHKVILDCLLLVALLVAVAGCGGTATPSPSPQPATPATLPVGTATPFPTQLPQPTLDPATRIGGGIVEQGPFTFELALYRDARMSPTTTLGPWAYSDLPGVGMRAVWTYHGPPLQGPIKELWGTEPDVGERGRLDRVQDGQQGGHTEGGILLPKEAKAGHTVRWVIKVQTPQRSYGAVLQFVLCQGPNGFEPMTISVEGMPPE